MFRVVHFQRITEDILIQRLWVIYLQIIIILTRAQSKLNYGQPGGVPCGGGRLKWDPERNGRTEKVNQEEKILLMIHF